MAFFAVYLDSTPLGMATQEKGKSPQSDECRAWVFRLLDNGIRVIIPEIADYEIRRELLRNKNKNGATRLTNLRDDVSYLAITTQAMERAAELWADARNTGRATADKHALDGDVIVSAQALVDAEAHGLQPDEFVIATINVRHLAHYANAALWQDITP